MSPLICLVGPTAAGKTATALALAERLQAEIVSVDSALVYRGMDIGSAKPSPAERARVRHWLIDIREPEQAYTAADFVRDAEAAIADIEARGKRPLVVGGTLLYVRALLQGLSELPQADPAIRQALEAELAELGSPALHRRLAEVDPVAAARIHPNDPQRILRALEVHAQTGVPISQLQGAWAQAPRRPGLLLALAPPDRGVLHRRIEARVDAMLAAGLIEEVRTLAARPGMRDDLPSMRCVGYRQVLGFLRGEYDLPRCRELIVYATRQLAKRQLTWLRGEPATRWFDPDQPGLIDVLLAEIASATAADANPTLTPALLNSGGPS